MTIQATPLAPLTKIPVTLTGAWNQKSKGRWQGFAHAAQPLVAVVMSTDGRSLAWCKAEKRLSDTLPIELAFLLANAPGLDVHMYFSTRQGQVLSRATIGTPGYQPLIPEKRSISTGEVIRFTLIESRPVIELSLLLILRQDVKGGRKGLWWLRRALQSTLPEPFAEILSYGRSGCIPWPKITG